MINFKAVLLTDKPWMDSCIAAENSRNCEFNFTNIFVWRDIYDVSAADVEGRLVFLREIFGKPYYSFPIGHGDIRASMLALTRDADERGMRFQMRSITADNCEMLDRLFPCSFEFIPERNSFDYIYSAEKLATLAGKQLHGKRNHINKFESTYSWSFEPITPDNIGLCESMNSQWENLHSDEESIESFNEEMLALGESFANFEALGLEGGILRADGEIAAFTIGEKLCSDTYVSHFEKAFPDIPGAYQMINREFAKFIMEKHPEIKYINREDDMGAENLRRAKASYYPEFMMEKFIALPKE